MALKELPLMPVPSQEWQNQYDEAMRDSYVKQKYNRDKRIREKLDYIAKYCQEIRHGNNSRVLDLGPGPGEFIEICRYYGLDAFGIDACPNQNEMGFQYGKLSQLMAVRQGLAISYDGVDPSKKRVFDFDDFMFGFVNSQGSIEQIFQDFLEGVPHRHHKNCNLLRWKTDQNTKDALLHFIEEVARILVPKGVFLVYGNGAQNVRQYNDMFMNAVKQSQAFEVLFSKDFRFHKLRKVL